MEYCEICKQQADEGALSTGQIPLTIPLLSHAAEESIPGITNVTPDAVEKYLKRWLTWVAVDVSSVLRSVLNLARTNQCHH